MTTRVGVEFDGTSRGAVTASRQTAAAIGEVTRSAKGTSQPLRGMEQDLGRTTRGAVAGSGAFRGLGRSIAFASAGFLGGYGLAAAVRGATNELVAQIKVNAQVDAALRSTKSVSGETAKAINDLAQAELRKTGIDDEVIKGAEAMLLRFTQVRDVVGKGNDIFGRATKTALDLSVALGRDATDAAFALGKALNDPTRGVQQLRRVGAAFTAEEAKQIKQLAEHGHVLEAQKAILDALTRSYGGTAEAVSNAAPWMRLRETLKNLSAEAIRPLLPEFDGLANRAQAYADNLENNADARAKFKQDVKDIVGPIKSFASGANDVAGALGGWKHVIEAVIGLKFAAVLAGWTGSLKALIGAEAAGGLLGAEAASTGLLGKMRLLVAKPWVVAIALSFIPPDAKGQKALDRAGIGFLGHLPIIGGAEQQIGALGAKVFGGRLVGNQGGSTAPNLSLQQKVVDAAILRGPNSNGVYVTGGTGSTIPGVSIHPQVGYDCSGYVYAAYLQAGIKIPRTSEAQWFDPNAVKVPKGAEQPGDGVYFEAKGNGYAPPGHCGIYIGNGRYIEYYQSGKPAKIANLADRSDYWGARRWTKVVQPGAAGGNAKPPTSGGGSTGSTNTLPDTIRQSIAAANIAVAQAALTPGKADDKAATAQAKAALEEEIQWLRAKLKTNIGAEKRITLEDLLTGALTDLGSLTGTKTKGGAGAASIISLRNTVANDLKGLPATLDDVEQNAVSHLQKLRAALSVGMSSKDLATTRVGISNWGKVLKTEIAKQAKIAAEAAQAAAAETARLWDQGWQNATTQVLRQFTENVAGPQIDAFDRETSGALKAMQDSLGRQLDTFDKETSAQLASIAAKYAAPTPAEKALSDFIAQRASDAEAKQKASLDSQIADVQAQLAALGVTTSGGGAFIDISTGTRTALQQTSTDIVDQQKQLTDQLTGLQEQRANLLLDDQQAALQATATASRDAANAQADADAQAYQDSRSAARQALSDKEADAEDSYTRLRASQRQALQDRLDDQQTALNDDLAQWNVWLGSKAKSWADFVRWMSAHGINSGPISNPDYTSAPTLIPGTNINFAGFTAAAANRNTFGFAKGGKVPGRYIGRDDTIMARVTPGETVIDRKLTAALEEMVASGSIGGGPTLAVFHLNGRQIATATAAPMSAEQARQIGYPIQRG
jgi:hypothetical protein